MDTISEMITTIPSRSLKATLIALKTAWTAFTMSPVTTQPRTKVATMQTRGVSLRRVIVTRIDDDEERVNPVRSGELHHCSPSFWYETATARQAKIPAIPALSTRLRI